MKETRVLIADDEENTCQLLAEYITSLGYNVDSALDGKKALEFLESNVYEFVFLDCNMPEVTGVELVKYLAQKKSKPRIIMMTGYDQIDEKFAEAVGVDVYLNKPIQLSDIKKLLVK